LRGAKVVAMEGHFAMPAAIIGIGIEDGVDDGEGLMRWEPRLDGDESGNARPLWQRLARLALIWAASVALLGAAAYLLCLWIA